MIHLKLTNHLNLKRSIVNLYMTQFSTRDEPGRWVDVFWFIQICCLFFLNVLIATCYIKNTTDLIKNFQNEKK